ncbi:MAG TPA: hypothetical protein VLA76_11890, partial [Candidatus Angelobacter sp.]|nr:hypothetical protein [Candidatus Angelobacter sp.]
MAEHLDLDFESVLRSTLKAEAASLPVGIEPEGVLRRREARRRRRAGRRLTLLLVAAVAALPLGLLAAAVLRPDPSEGYSAVLVRTADDGDIQVLLARDGASQRVVDVPVSRFGAVEYPQVVEANASGWIAFWATDVPEAAAPNEYVVLFDVRDARPPIVRAGTHLGTWTTDGRYWSVTNHAYELIDPASGDVTSRPRGVTGELDAWPLGGPLRVASDGSGLLVGDLSNVVYDEAGRAYPQQWAVLSPAGILSEGLPELAGGTGSRVLSARWGLLQWCEHRATFACPGRRSGTIVSGPGDDGSYREWGGPPPAHDHVIGASWAVDGGLWLLVDRRSGVRTIVLIHRDANHIDREVAAFVVGMDEDLAIGDLAPDDSLIALQLSGDWPRVKTVIVDTSTGQSHLFDGALGGFVPTALAREWVADEAETEAGQVLAKASADGGSEPAYAPRPSLGEQLQGLSAERILLVHEIEATAADPGPAI